VLTTRLGANLVAHDAANQATKLPRNWNAGVRSALDALLPLVYDEQRRLAHHLRDERPPHTLQSTAMLNEAYLRLVGKNLPKETSR
jgi:RNA polymerase sigma-70 factor (ECF subfamily)